MGQADAERVEFASRQGWRDWLEQNHDSSSGVFVVYLKKSAQRRQERAHEPAQRRQERAHEPASGAAASVGPRYEDLIEEALCFGWVDGTLRPVDDERTSLYFCPRRRGSVWAASNKARVERLRAAGLMTAAGEAAIERAKADGSWTILDRSEALIVPDELAQAFDAHPGSAEQFAGFPASGRKQLIYWVDSAKRPETRQRRAEEIARLARQGVRADRQEPGRPA